MQTGIATSVPATTIASGGSPVCAPTSALITDSDGHRADHHHLAVREVDELDDPVDHRVAERDDRVDAAERQAVDDLLQEDVHGSFVGSAMCGLRR